MNQYIPYLKKYITPLIVLLVLVGLYSLWNIKSYITVTGTYEAEVANQRASFNAYLESRDDDRQVAADSLSQKTQEILNSLREFGISDDDLRTTNVNVFQEQLYNPDTSRSEPGDWIAGTNIEITLDDGSRSEELTALLASLDINNYYGPNYTFVNENVDEGQLLIGAYENAREKAESMAQMRGMRLGRMVTFVEGYAPGGSIPFERGLMDGLGGAGGIPIQPGTSDVSKTVTITFELKPF